MNKGNETQKYSDRGRRNKPRAEATSDPSKPLPNMQQQQQRRTDSRDRTGFQNSSSNGRSYSGGGLGAGNSNVNAGGGAGGSWNGPGGSASNGSGIVDDHVPVNGFNAKEIKDFLNNAYNASHSSALDSKSTDKPVVYKVADNGWTTTNKPSAWGPKQHLMSNGTDLLSKLKKGVASLNTTATPAPKDEPKA